jgi:oxygen-independent coproporphyrinogen-3 oxidase
MSVDLGLLRKYDRPGPRYTSYPPAPLFTEAYGPADYAADVRASAAGGRPLSLYFHLPFCHARCFFCGCNVIVTRSHDRVDEYLDHLEREIALVAGMLGPSRPVIQLAWGGGTPTHLTPEQIRRLAAAIRAHFSIAPDAETSVEIDPRGIDRAHLEALREAGFGRASVGVQDFEPEVQQAINREQPYELTRWAVTTLRELGFASVNLDLIYGLPRQNEERFARTLETVLTLAPDRLAVFSYAHVPWVKRNQKAITVEELPPPEVKLAMLKLTIERLAAAGLEHIGMDHFARPEDELAVAQREGKLHRNFQGYSTRGGTDLLAFGVTGISGLARCYAQNVKELEDYYARISAGALPTERGLRLSDDDLLRRQVIQELMCNLRLDTAEISRRLGLDFDRRLAAEIGALAEMEADGLVQRRPGRIEVTSLGRLFVRNVAMCFDAYLGGAAGQPLYSRTV